LARKKLYEPDISSAYPAIIAELPSLAGGRWTRVLNPMREQIRRSCIVSMFRVRTQGMSRGHPFYPFPFRCKDGAVVYPPDVDGLYMRDDVLAGFAWADGLESGHDETIEVTEALIFEPADPAHKPFAWVKELFDYRAELVKADKNSVLGNVIKLMLNSLYGKFAQGIGGFGRLPRFACPWYAAAITAGTRLKLMEAGVTAPAHVDAFTTDALVMDKPPEFETTARGVKELGKWEYPKLYLRASLVMPGVNYTVDEKGEGNMKTRGFRAAHAIDEKESATPTLERIMLEEIPAAWEADKAEYLYVYQKYNGVGSALQTRFPGKVMGTWQVSQRGIKLTNATQKRTLPMDEKGARLRCSRARRLIDLPVSQFGEHFGFGQFSAPHSPKWLNEGLEGEAEMSAEELNIIGGLAGGD
jgi:hypothetical protein